MIWIEGDVGTVQNIRCIQADGSLRTFGGSADVDLLVKPADKQEATATVLQGVVVESGLVTYTRAAGDVTAGRYVVRVRHTEGSDIGHSQQLPLEVIKP